MMEFQQRYKKPILSELEDMAKNYILGNPHRYRPLYEKVLKVDEKSQTIKW